MANPRMKTMGPDCPCTNCTAFSDAFNRDNETINGLDSTTNWTCVPDLSGLDPDGLAWEIKKTSSSPSVQGCLRVRHVNASGNPVGAGVPYTYFRAVCEQVVPRHFSCSVDVACDSEDSIVNVTYQAISVDAPTTDRRYKVRLQWSPTPYGEEGGDTDCGFISLWDVTDLDAPVQLGWDVPVAGLSAGFIHRVTLCYDPETQLLSAHVKTDITGVGELGSVTHYIHAKNCPSPEDPLELSQVWLQVEDFGSLADAGALDHQVVWDNFSISQTKNLANTGYYYYGDEDDPNCPCCGRGGCSVVSDDFEDGVIDCRWYQSAGTWTESGGKIATGSNGNSRLTWLGSWSGINDDCEPDCSVRVATLVKSPDGLGWTWVIELDYQDSSNYHYARLNLTGNYLGVSDDSTGTLKIYRVEGGSSTELASVDVGPFTGVTDVTFTACMLYDELTATVSGGSVSESVSETVGGYGSGAFCGPFVRIGTSGSGAPFYNFEVSHNLDSPDCPDCFSGQSHVFDDGEDCPPESPYQNCVDGLYPAALLVRLNVIPGDGAECPDFCSDISGGYVVPLLPGSCSFAPEGAAFGNSCTHGDGPDEFPTATPNSDPQCTCLYQGCFPLESWCPGFVVAGLGAVAIITVLVLKLEDGGYGIFGLMTITSGTCESDHIHNESASFLGPSLSDSPLDCVSGIDAQLDFLCYGDSNVDEDDHYACRFFYGGGTVTMRVSSI